ncbi:MAG: bifunctional acetate--CoA ligase family protein/GNAT family N-acetyltransferase [Ignavibacteriaceae bacterium]
MLKNGQGILFKPATTSDIPLVNSFMKRVSRESLRMRFMAFVSEVPQKYIEELCSGDFTQSGCLLVITGEGKDIKVVGLGNYVSMGNGQTAEVAFLVEDKYQGIGISALLLERLAGLAAANGFVELEAEVLPDNQAMIHVFKDSGFERHQVWSSDLVHIELPVTGAAALWERADLRERIAVANSLIPLLHPKVVAVIGASRESSSIGNIIFRNILAGNFKGTIYPVNPQAVSVNGVKAYSSVNDLPEPIDLAVIAVRAEKVQEIAERVIQAGAKGLVIVSAGFAEAGPEGKQRQKNLVALVRAHGVRLLGPSCLGLMNTSPEVSLNASLAPNIMKHGHAGFFSHSAALGLVILEYAKEKGVGFSTFVSAGNRADISGNDLLQYWEEDPDTKMAILYLETFGNPRRFVRIARRMTYKKPILCVKSAHSIAGRKAAEAKSGVHSGGELEVGALFEQTGIILSPTLEDLFDVAVVISHQPLPKGNRVSIVANSSGMATIFADACETNDLILEGPGVVDLGAFTSADNYEIAVREALLNENVDSLFIGFACVGNCKTEAVAAAIRRGVSTAEEKSGNEKPVLLCFMGAVGIVSLVDEDGYKNNPRKFPAFRFPEAAVSALSRIVRYVEFRKQPLGKLIWYEDIQADEARRIIQFEISKSPDQIIQLEKDSAVKILNLFGIQVVNTHLPDSARVKIKVKPDHLFGPLIEIEISDSNTIIRITPLTDRDLEETMKEINLDKSNGIGQALGRISQMIEELPWLWELEVHAVEFSEPLLLSDIFMTIKSGGAKRPVY